MGRIHSAEPRYTFRNIKTWTKGNFCFLFQVDSVHGQATHSYRAKTVIAKPHTMSLRCLARVPQGARATEYEAASAPGHLVRQLPQLTSHLRVDLWLSTHCLQFVYFIFVLMRGVLTSLFSLLSCTFKIPLFH